jgi:uncharacterized cupin superfamily protein
MFPHMSSPNVFEPEWEIELPEPFRLRGMRLGPRVGAQRLGATLYEMEPGGAVSPYHVHHANEEMLLVVAGRPSLRTPEGTRELAPGDVVAFKAGPEGAHRVFNGSGEPARVLLISTMVFPEIAEHLDTGAWLSMTGPSEGKVFPDGTDVSIIEAIQRGMREGGERDG